MRYILKTSAKDTDDLFIGFDRDPNRRQRELTNNNNIKRKRHLRIMLKDILGSTEKQEKVTYGSVYKLTLTRISDNAVLNKDNAINNDEIKIIAIEWYVPHYTPSITQQAIFSKQF